MFRDLKLVKIIVFVFLFVAIVFAQITDHKNIEIIFKSKAFLSDEELNFQICSNTNEEKAPFIVRKVTSNAIVLDTTLKVNKTYDFFDEVDMLTQSNPSEPAFINKKFEAGIYTVNNKFPLVVRSEKKSDVTIVVPIINKHFYTFSNEKRIFESDSSFISKNRSIRLDEWTKGLAHFISELEENYNVNYITDLDLENNRLLKQSKVLVLYGRLTFWSHKMMDNFETFINQGGKVLIASSDVFYAKFCNNEETQRFTTLECVKIEEQGEKIQTWHKINNTNDFNKFRYKFHSNYGGENEDHSGLEINQKSHPIFKGVNLDDIAKDLDIGDRYLGIPKEGHGINIQSLSAIAETQCKPNKNNEKPIGGIFEYNENGSKAIVIGTSDLCLEDSQKKKDILKLFLNSIDYLMK